VNIMYVCSTTLCADDVQTVPVWAAECSGSAFWANHIFLEGSSPNIKI
jgi:hypothetical protein